MLPFTLGRGLALLVQPRWERSCGVRVERFSTKGGLCLRLRHTDCMALLAFKSPAVGGTNHFILQILTLHILLSIYDQHVWR